MLRLRLSFFLFFMQIHTYTIFYTIYILSCNRKQSLSIFRYPIVTWTQSAHKLYYDTNDLI